MVAAMTSGSASDCELRSGEWQDVLADVGEVDTLISDPPYSERTHSGHDDGVNGIGEAAAKRQRVDKRNGSKYAVGVNRRRQLEYTPWSPPDVERFVAAWSSRVRGWFVAMTDHVLAPVYERALEAQGRYVFSPLSFVWPGRSVRLAGDGPAQWAISVVVARPKTRDFQHWGALRGAYVLPPGQGALGESGVMGGKPLWLMRALVRDYSRPGDLIVDPCAGGATTLIAARMEGRRSIGAERDPVTFELARKRLAKPYTPLLFGDELRARAVAVANDNGHAVEQGELMWSKATASDVDP